MATTPATPPALMFPSNSPLSIDSVYEVFPTIDRDVINDIVHANNGAYTPSFEALMMLADPDYVPETPPLLSARTTTSAEQLQNDQQYARFLLQQENNAMSQERAVGPPPSSDPNILWVPVQAPVGDQGQPVVYVHYPSGSPQRRNADSKPSGKKSIMNFFGKRKTPKPVVSDTPPVNDILPVQDSPPARRAPPTQFPSSHSLLTDTHYTRPLTRADVTPVAHPTENPFSDWNAMPASGRAFEHVFGDDEERLVRNRRSRGNDDERYEVEDGEEIEEPYAAKPVSEEESELYHHSSYRRLRSP